MKSQFSPVQIALQQPVFSNSKMSLNSEACASSSAGSRSPVMNGGEEG